MSLTTIVLPFFKGIINKLSISLATDLIKKNFGKSYQSISGLLNTKSSYKRKLLVELQSMPFIYRNIDSDIFDDYVVVEGVSIDIKTMTETNSKQLSSLLHKKRVIFFGNAGIGKTTFFRHSALSILKGKYEEHLKDAREFFPIFIQLKAVNNFDKSPIINYILKEIPYFKVKNGKERLLKLAKTNKLFILLDGYDEIGFVESTNYISFELSTLMQGDRDVTKSNSYLNNDFIQLYRALSHCKIWLSTRKEFFKLNPLVLNIHRHGYDPRTSLDLYDPNFLSLVLKGLGNNRFRLIKIIFDKYKGKSEIFKEKLDEEQFYNDLQKTNDIKLIELSKNPLFLTIMCYLYADKIEKGASIEEKWLTNSYDLINDCIKTLLIDLDKFKVRDLSGVRKSTFQQRRSDYFNEKFEFLRHFALKSYMDGKNTIHIEYLTDCAIAYFADISNSPNKTIILRQIEEKSDLSNSNIVKQILYSGIFILIPGISQNYDFPHRRFKETLALEALSDDLPLDLDLLNKNLSEFIQILFQNKPSRRREITLKILEQLEVENQGHLYLNQLLYNCLLTTPEFNPSELIESKITDWLHKNSKILISYDLINLCKFSPNLLVNFNQTGDNLREKYFSQSLIFGILIANYLPNPAKFYLESNSYDENTVSFVIQNLYRLASENRNATFLIKYFSDCIDQENFPAALSVLFIDRTNKELYDTFLEKLFTSIRWKHKFSGLYMIFTFKPEEYTQLQKNRTLQEDPRIGYTFQFFSSYVFSKFNPNFIITSKINAKLTKELESDLEKLDLFETRKSATKEDDTKATSNTELKRQMEAYQDKINKLSEVKSEAETFKENIYEQGLDKLDIIPRNILEFISSGVYSNWPNL